MPGKGTIPKELAQHWMVPYVSTERPLNTLYMDLVAPARGGPWPPLLLFHGWHQDLTSQRQRANRLASRGFCVLNLNLRGRCGTIGLPDANGWEIRDATDALESARRLFPQLCASTLPPRAFGASGGGGNVYALVGKCPDFLASAVVWCGISDYAAWFEWDQVGQYRDEMVHWIGRGPKENQEGYRSRSGLTVVANRSCPLLVLHGVADRSVPIEQGQGYAHATRLLGAHAALLKFTALEGVGHEIPEEPHLADSCEFLLQHAKPVYIPQRGHWFVAGYLKSHYFEIFWDHVGLVGEVEVDLRRRKLNLKCPSSGAAQVRLAGHVTEPRLSSPDAKGCRILSTRHEAGWTIIDLQMHGQSVGLRWKV